MREKQFEEQVKRFLESAGIYRIGTAADKMTVEPTGYWIKRWGGSKYVPAGVPDMQITVGVFNVDVELKSETGKLDPLQVQKLKQIKQFGGFAIVLRPKDFEEFKSFIWYLIARNWQLRETGEVWGCEIGEGELFTDRNV